MPFHGGQDSANGIGETQASWRAGRTFAIYILVILLLFVIGGVLSAIRKDLSSGFDEAAQAGYLAETQDGHMWPDLNHLRMLDAKTLRLNAKANYLNHPPVYYDLLGLLGPQLEGHPGVLLYFRLLNVALTAIGLAVILRMGFRLCATKSSFYAYSVPLFCIPVLIPLAGSINNDNAAFCGGCIALAGLFRWLSSRGRSGLCVMLAGLLLASWAKLTGLLLTGILVAAGLLYLVWRGHIRRAQGAAAIVAVLVAALPYVLLTIQYGSPAPNTLAQEAALRSGASAAGWTDRLSFFPYAINFLCQFIASWMPTLSPRGPFQYAMLAFPLAAVGFALHGTIGAASRLVHGKERPIDILLLSGIAAFVVTFSCHIAFSYARHLATGWMMDAYLRYYLPIVAVVPLGGLIAAEAMREDRWRRALLTFLTASPIIFELFGAPHAF